MAVFVVVYLSIQHIPKLTAMRLSIIVPVYNVERYLDECISSLFNQGLADDDFEVLLIDDGSTDTSFSIASKWAEHKKNVFVYRQENRGQAVARNLGLDKACGQYVMFVDSDDYLLPHKLEPILRIADDNRLDAVVYCMKLQRPTGSDSVSKIPNVRYDHIYSGEDVALNFFVFGSMCRGLFSRAIFEKHNLRFRTGFAHEDSELCFRLFPLLGKLIFTDDEVYYYRYNEHSTDRNRTRELLKRNIESEAIIVSKIFEDINSLVYSETVGMRYRRIANSIIIGFFGRIRENKIWNMSEFDRKLDWLQTIGVYPISGMTNSWKSDIFSKILNYRYFLKLYLYGC